MPNPIEGIKNWFFELIEDAVGEKTMKKYKEEIERKSNDQKQED